MNRIQRIATAAALGTAVLAPTTAAVASAEPYPWHRDGTSQSQTLPKAQIEHQEALQLRQESAVSDERATSATTDTGIPWDVLGLAALGGVALGAAAIVGVRYVQRQPTHA